MTNHRGHGELRIWFSEFVKKEYFFGRFFRLPSIIVQPKLPSRPSCVFSRSSAVKKRKGEQASSWPFLRHGHFCSGGFLALSSSSSFVWEGTDEMSMNSSWGSSMFSFSRLGRSSGSFSRLMVWLHSKPKCLGLPFFCALVRRLPAVLLRKHIGRALSDVTRQRRGLIVTGLCRPLIPSPRAKQSKILKARGVPKAWSNVACNSV